MAEIHQVCVPHCSLTTHIRRTCTSRSLNKLFKTCMMCSCSSSWLSFNASNKRPNTLMYSCRTAGLASMLRFNKLVKCTLFLRTKDRSMENNCPKHAVDRNLVCSSLDSNCDANVGMTVSNNGSLNPVFIFVTSNNS